MKASSPNKFYLEVIPVILNNKNILCLPGQAFDTSSCTLFLYTALSYDGKAWYSDIDNEDPVSEYDLYKNNLHDYILGYNQGLHIINLKTGKRSFKPITIKEFIRVRSKSEKITLNKYFLDLFEKPKITKDKYNVNTLNRSKLGILYDIAATKSVYSNFPMYDYLRALRKSVIGLPGNYPNVPEMTFSEFLRDNTLNIKLPLKSVVWNHKSPWDSFDSKIRHWYYN